MNLTRRQGLISLAAIPLLLSACGTSSQTVDQQILADVEGLVPTFQAIVASIVATDPKAISAATQTQIAALEQSASAALTQLQAGVSSLPTAATLLQTIDTYLNAALTAVGAALPAAAKAFPSLAQYVPMYDAGVALIEGVLEPYINSLVPADKAALKSHMRAVKKLPTADEARSTLHIKIVH